MSKAQTIIAHRFNGLILTKQDALALLQTLKIQVPS